MSLYTIELRYLIENGFDIGLNDYPIFDENYRSVLNQKIVDRYYFEEICCGTPERFKYYLNSQMRRIMPYYNKLYEAELQLDMPLQSKNIIENYQNESESKGTASGTANAENTSTGSVTGLSNTTGNTNVELNSTLTDDVTQTKTGTEDRTHNKTGTDTTDKTNKFLDTPESSITNMNNYLTNTTTDESTITYNTTDTDNVEYDITDGTDGTHTTTGTQDTTSGSNTNTSNTTNNTDNSETTTNSTSTITDTSSYLRQITGYDNVSQSQLFSEYYNALINIDNMIIDELAENFILLLEVH